ncbi:hypothetical protein [uncultured Actinomyces sp.]|nr:hypothetical protein [uncultured Actinomyces sp.]
MSTRAGPPLLSSRPLAAATEHMFIRMGRTVSRRPVSVVVMWRCSPPS